MSINKIAIIGIDGLSKNFMPKEFLENSIYTPYLRSVYPSESMTNWAALLYSLDPSITGVINNGWDNYEALLPPALGDKSLCKWFPNLLSIANFTIITSWQRFNDLFLGTNLKNRFWSTDREVIDDVEIVLRTSTPNMFIHLNDVDETAHQGLNIDSVVKQLGFDLKRLENILTAHDYLMIFLSDHGRRYDITFHGGYSPAEMDTYLIIRGGNFGSNVKGKELITHPISIMDIAPTITFLLNISTPDIWRGRVIWELVDLLNTTNEINITKKCGMNEYVKLDVCRSRRDNIIDRDSLDVPSFILGMVVVLVPVLIFIFVILSRKIKVSI